MFNPDYMPNGLPAMLDYSNMQNEDMALPVLVDIAISLRILSGRGVFDDTPVHRQVRKLMKEGKKPNTSTMSPPERKYYEAICHYYEIFPTDRNAQENSDVADYDVIYYGKKTDE